MSISFPTLLDTINFIIKYLVVNINKNWITKPIKNILLGKANPLLKKAIAIVAMLINNKEMKIITAFSNKDFLIVEIIL
jgi:hypothetical protein